MEGGTGIASYPPSEPSRTETRKRLPVGNSATKAPPVEVRQAPGRGESVGRSAVMSLRHLVAAFTVVSPIGALCLGVLGFAALPGATAAQDLAGMVRAVKQAQDETTLFGSIEMRRDSLRGLQQWQRVVSAMQAAGSRFSSCAGNVASCNSSMLKSWREIVVAAKRLPYKERLKSVNESFNRWPYKLDMEVYGVREYWATPKEFIIHSGDCEDYSIAKYYALRNVGYSEEELRIVVLLDTIRGYGHAVLAVYVGSDILILDNTTPLVLSHIRFSHYRPQVSMNEISRWAHVSSAAQRENTAAGSRSSSGLSASNLFQRNR